MTAVQPNIRPPIGAQPPTERRTEPPRIETTINTDTIEELVVRYARGTMLYSTADPLMLDIDMTEWARSVSPTDGEAFVLTAESVDALRETMRRHGRFRCAETGEDTTPNGTEVWQLYLSIRGWLNRVGKAWSDTLS